eukprot:ctg_1775.g507
MEATVAADSGGHPRRPCPVSAAAFLSGLGTRAAATAADRQMPDRRVGNYRATSLGVLRFIGCTRRALYAAGVAHGARGLRLRRGAGGRSAGGGFGGRRGDSAGGGAQRRRGAPRRDRARRNGMHTQCMCAAGQLATQSTRQRCRRRRALAHDSIQHAGTVRDVSERAAVGAGDRAGVWRAGHASGRGRIVYAPAATCAAPSVPQAGTRARRRAGRGVGRVAAGIFSTAAPRVHRRDGHLTHISEAALGAQR